jgi:hypothetical protein
MSVTAPRLGAGLLAFALLLGIVQTAASTVPATKAGLVIDTLTATKLAPVACSALLLTGVTWGDGDLAAILPNRLFLGGPGDQRVTGTAGTDCIVGGSGNDILDGSGGNDVCIGSATSTFISCEVALTW